MKNVILILIFVSLIQGISIGLSAAPVVINGTIVYENGSVLASYNIHNNIVVQANGTFTIQEGIDGITLGDTLYFNAAPTGYEFYPKKIIVDQSKNVNIVCYKGIVVDQPYQAGSMIHWNSDTVNVFTNIILNSSSLNIRSNTKVKFHGHYRISLSGTSSIKAIGTSDKPIIFTSADTTGFQPFKPYTNSGTGGWNSILFKALSTYADSSVFKFCTFEYSKGISSGGKESSTITIYDSARVYISHCTFYKNYGTNTNFGTQGSGGGAIRAHKARVTIDNCFFNENYCFDRFQYGGGGAIAAYQSNLKIINCTFINNSMKDSYGGAVYSQESFIDLANSILYGNSDLTGNNSLYGSSFRIYNCDVEGLNIFGTNIIENSFSADPLFTNTHTGDYSLQPNSPCINGGNPSYIPSENAVDINGNNRVHQGFIDIGATEFQNDISLAVSGNLQKENGEIMAVHEFLPGYATNLNGDFYIEIANSDFAFGDTLEFMNPVGYEIYPSRVIIGWDKPRAFHLVAYKGIVVDEADSFKDDVTWNADTVNVFRNVDITSSKLTIGKGTVVRFHNYCGVNISGNGVILAEGTLADTIIFSTAWPLLANPKSDHFGNCWKGIYFNSSTNVTDTSILAYCKIEYGKRDHYAEAGGIQVNYYNNLIIRNSKISNNRGMGGIGINRSNIALINCNISHNYIFPQAMWMYAEGGAGLNIDKCNPYIVGCIISYNFTRNFGGGILLDGASPTIINCSIINNDAEWTCTGQSIFMIRNSFPSIYNSVLTGDEATQIDFYDQSCSQVRIYNSLIKGGNNISAGIYKNSFALDMQASDIMNADFSLKEGSPCINHGTDSLPGPVLNKDIFNNLRKMGKTIDIGASEYKETTVYITTPFEALLDSFILFKGNVFMGTVSNWSWDFNEDDIEDSDLQEAEYAYQQIGDYLVRLVATVTELGKNDTVYVKISIVAVPEVVFSVDTTSGTVPFTVQFTDESLNSPASWFWDFGDGFTSTMQHPNHTYSSSGIYTVKLVAENNAGHDSVVYKHLITVTSPTHVDASETDKIFVSPNPASSYLTVWADKNYNIRLMDIAGRILQQTTMINGTSTLDISSFQNGFLILQLTNQGETIVRKIIKK